MPKDLREAARLLGAAALADYTDAQVEYAIALFNGTGVAKDEARRPCCSARPRARATRSRRTAWPASSRPAAASRPIRSRRSNGTWCRSGGGDATSRLDEFVQKQKPDIRAAGEKAAQPWIEAIKQPRS